MTTIDRDRMCNMRCTLRMQVAIIVDQAISRFDHPHNMPEPFVIQNCVSIRGGYGDKAVFLPYENGEKGTPYENDKFVALAPYNKELLILLFPKQQVPRYKHGHPKPFPEKFTKHMQKLRDAVVDEIMLN